MIESSLRGDLRWGTFGGLLDDAAARRPDHAAIVDTDRTLTTAELRDEAGSFARSLIHHGVERGDRIAVWTPNRWEFVVAALGAQSIGVAVVPINTRYKGREAAYVLGKSRPRLLVSVGEFLGVDYDESLVAAGWEGTDTGCLVVTLDPPEGCERTGWDEFLAMGDDIEETELAARAAAVTGRDVSDVLFTSGTTGAPKGVMTTQAQNLRAYLDWSTIAGFDSGDRYAVINPFFHAFGYKVGWLSALMHGITIYPHAVLDVPLLLRQVEGERITLLPGPPALYESIFEERRRQDYDLTSLRLAVTGAASVSPALVKQMKSELGFDRITNCYGLTEGTAIGTITRADDDPETVATRTGRALPDVELRVDAAGSRPEEPGEVLLRGYNVMLGYLDGPDDTAAVIDSEGWLHTGDIGILDAAGYLRVTDRKDDMFTVGGFNAYPAEIEHVIGEHEGVSQVAVIGIPDPRLGQVPSAYVVPSGDADLDADELIRWCRSRLANFKVPRRVVVVSELPRNATGKVTKTRLRDVAAEELKS